MKEKAEAPAAKVAPSPILEESIAAGGFRVNHHEGESSNYEISRDYANDLINICSWLLECPRKTLMIESEDSVAESNEIPSMHDVKDVKRHIEYQEFKIPFPTKHENSVGENPNEHERGKGSTGENPCEANGEHTHQDMVNYNHNETELEPMYNENDKNPIQSPKENEKILVEREIGDNDHDHKDEEEEEEEYYLIEEEIIEEEEEEEEPTGDNCFERTGEDRKEKKKESPKRRKRRDHEVFVGGLDWRATKQDVYEVFSQTGDVLSIRMTFNPRTNENKGYAFVSYATAEQAKLTLSKLKYPLVRSRRCEVRASQENDTLFLGNICKTWTKEQLREALRSFGICDYKELVLIEDQRDRARNKGFAFLEFWSLPDAKRVYEALLRSRLVLGTDRAVKVSFAVLDEQNPEIMAKVTAVFIDGISSSWEEDYVKSCLKKYGKIEHVKLAKYMKTAKRLNFGHVTFDSHENAVKCIEGVNEKGMGEKGHRKVKVIAALCRPLEPRFSGQAKNSFRRAKSSFGRNVSKSPARISKRASKSRVSPVRRHERERHNGLMDVDPLMSLSKRSRCVYSSERGEYKRIKLPRDFGHEISREEYKRRSEYSSSHDISERRYYRDDDYYHYYEHEYREKSCHEKEGHIRKFNRSGRSMCQYDIQDERHDMNEESSIRRSKPRFDHVANSCSQRCEPSRAAYRTSNGIPFSEQMYNPHDDMDYRGGSTCTYGMSSKCSSRGPYVGGSSSSSLHVEGSLPREASRQCECCVKKEYYWD